MAYFGFDGLARLMVVVMTFSLTALISLVVVRVIWKK